MTTSEIRNQLKELNKTWNGNIPDEILELPLSGSSRRYFRLKQGEKHVIGTYNSDLVENEAYFYLADQLTKKGVNIPEVYFTDKARGLYLQEDLGNTNLFEYATSDGVSEEDLFEVYKKIVDQMPSIQYEVARDLDFAKCYPRSAFDRQSIQWDLNYFKYNFLKLADIPFHEQKLEDDFQRLIDYLLEAPANFFLYRDFQSRNIMLHNDEVYFIDFQGGRQGALQYDLASLLFESKINLSPEFRDKVLTYYLDVFDEYDFFSRESFLKYFPAFVLTRLLQAFGAYGFRGLFEKKAFFVKSINQGLKRLKEIIGDSELQQFVPYLCELIERMLLQQSKFSIPELASGLTVSVNSFSFMKGLPDDWSGNGGGFIFDCRVLPNPGRIEKYRSSTGRDADVIAFMQEKADVNEFLNHAKSLISKSVSEYINRGFSSLSVSFGCTGGQHRSVYSAEKVYEWLKMNFDVNIRLIHREQNIEEYYDKNNVQKE
jgi:aminoglycoside/choline kinase family phosphotransferase